jgi:uncharacterized protein (DUF433 family)
MADNRHPRISLDPKVCHGKPVIKGTRVMVSTVLGHLAGGDPIPHIVTDFGITEEDVRAAVAYALEALEHERHYPLSA